MTGAGEVAVQRRFGDAGFGGDLAGGCVLRRTRLHPSRSRVCTTIMSPSRAYPSSEVSPRRSTLAPHGRRHRAGPLFAAHGSLSGQAD